MFQVYSESASSLETISRWIYTFVPEKLELKDEQCSGGTGTSVTIIEEDPTVTPVLITEAWRQYGSAQDMVLKHLGLMGEWAP